MPKKAPARTPAPAPAPAADSDEESSGGESSQLIVAAAISEFGPAATANALSSQDLLLFRLRRTQPARLGGALCFGFSPPAGPTQTFFYSVTQLRCWLMTVTTTSFRATSSIIVCRCTVCNLIQPQAFLGNDLVPSAWTFIARIIDPP